MNNIKPKSHFFSLLKTAFATKRYVFYLLTPLVGILSFLPFEKETFNTKKISNTVQEPTKFEEAAPYKIRKIVLDAGHGGFDTGCQTEHGVEKNNTLAMTKRLGALIKQRYPEIEIIYTRDKDEFIELNKRADIANKAKADLFISIHCNSTDEASGAYGTETYVLGNHRKDDNFEVARRENQSILLENDYKTQYDGFDPNSTEAYIIFSLYQNAYLDKSIVFAKYVEENLQNHANRKSLGVKQAGFIVLKETAMPSVLIETGFLNNRKDGEFISSEAGQETIAESVFNAVAQFKQTVEENKDDGLVVSDETKQSPHSPLTTHHSVDLNNSFENPATVRKAKKVETRTELVSAAPKPEVKKAVAKLHEKKTDVPARLLANELVYKVQLSVETNDARQSGRFKSLSDLEIQKDGAQFKILKLAGTDYCNAVKVVHAVRQKGFNDAFIVAYKNGERVKVPTEKCAL